MKVITAPESYGVQPGEISVFLAGGICKCPEWQDAVINKLESSVTHDLVVFNPRRKNFPIDDKSASYQQIGWEFDNLQRADIFSMYFCESESDQPICMYELGRNILHMQLSHPTDWEHRIVISVEAGYKRKQDVIMQVFLAAGDKVMVNTNLMNDTVLFYHTEHILKSYRYLTVHQ